MNKITKKIKYIKGNKKNVIVGINPKDRDYYSNNSMSKKELIKNYFIYKNAIEKFNLLKKTL